MLYDKLTDEEYNQEQHDYYASYLEDQVDCHINNG
jgi:hypothetical protein